MIKQRIEDKLVYIELWKSRMVSPSNLLQVHASNFDRPQLDRAKSELYQSILETARMLRREKRARGNEEDGLTMIPESLDEPRINLLRALEYDLCFEDLLMFRSMAEMTVSQETRNQSWLGSIFSWATGGKPTAVSDEERRKLFEALKYDPDKLFRGGAKEVDPNEVTTIINLHLKEGSVTLGLSSSDTSSTFQAAIPFLQLKLCELHTKTVIMGDGSHVRVNLSLQDIEGFEIYPSNNRNKKMQLEMIHHRFIFRRNLRSSYTADNKTVDTESNISFSEDKSILSTNRGTKNSIPIPPLFVCTVELSPNNKDVEVAVRLEMEELEIWFSPTAKWLDSVAIFGAWPEDLKYWSEMEMKAMNQLADFKSRINAKLEYMMNNHSNILIEGKVRAPVIIIHDKPSASLDGKMNILVIDLGSISLHTEKLAKAQRRKDLEALSQFTVAASNILQSSMAINSSTLPGEFVAVDAKKDEKSKGWEMLQNEFGRAMVAADTGSSIIDQPDDLDLLVGNLPDENQSYPGEHGMGTGGRRSSIFQQYGKRTVLDDQNPEIGDFDSAEEELFDVFQCQVTDLEVYLVEAIVMRDLHSKGGWYAQYDLEKTTIVPKFEIGVEIQVSALPWDITLPPVKLFVDIPEVNVQLSEIKLMRLAQFGADLAKGSTVFLENNIGKIQKFNEAVNRSSTGNEFSVKAQSTNRQSFGAGHSVNSVTKSAKSMRSKKARRARSFGGSVSSQRPQSEYEFFDVHSEYGKQSVISDYKSAMSMQSDQGKRLKQLEDGGEMVRSYIGDRGNTANRHDDDSDDESFFSVDDNLDPNEHVKALEELKYVITQRESLRAKLITDVRITEADPGKSALHESLKQELNSLEMDLHQLKISYVELMMQHQDYLQSFEDEKGIDEYDPDLFKEQVETILSPSIDKVGAGASHKRDLIHASVFKLSNLDKGLQILDIMGPNKELVYVRLNIARVNVDLQVEVSRSVSPHVPVSPEFRMAGSIRRESFPATTVPAGIDTVSLIYRLSLSDIGVKLRHRVHNSRISFYLRDINFMEHTVISTTSNLTGNRMRFDDFVSQSRLPFITSDPSFASMLHMPINRSYTSMGSNELIRLKYEVTYHRSREVDSKGIITYPQSTSHSVSLHVGYLAISLDQDRLNPLVDWSTQFQKKIIEKFSPDKDKPLEALEDEKPNGDNEGGSHQDINDKEDPKILSGLVLPILESSIKIDGVSLGIIRGAFPIMSANVSTISMKIRADGQQGNVACQVADVSVYNLLQLNPSNISLGNKLFNRPSDSELGARNMIFGRNANEEAPFMGLKISFSNLDRRKFSVKVHGAVKLASIVIVSDAALIQELTRECVKGSLMQTLQRNQSNSQRITPQSIPMPTGRKICLLDQVFQTMEGIHSNIGISMGSVKFFIPCNSKFVKDDRVSDLQFSIGGMKSRFCVGSYCSTDQGKCVELSVSVEKIGLRIACLDIVDTFDLGCLMKVVPSVAFLEECQYSPSMSMKSVNNLTFDLPLPLLNLIQPNEVQFAVSVSPISAHISKEIIDHFVTWMKSLEDMFDQVSRIIDNDSKTIVDSSSKIRLGPSLAPLQDPLKFMDIDFLITFGVKVQELNLYLNHHPSGGFGNYSNQNNIPFPTSPGFSQSASQETKFDFTNISSPKRGVGVHPSSDGMLWTIFATIRGTEMIAKCYPKEYYDAREHSISSHLIGLTVGIQYFGFHEQNQYGHVNRIFCSGAAYNGENSSSAQSDFNGECSNVPFFAGNTCVFYDLSINSCVTIAEINGIYHGPTISRLIDVVVGFLEPCAGGNQKMRTQLMPNQVSTRTVHPGKAKSDDHAAHPSSIPMSPVLLETQEKNAEFIEQPLQTTIFLFDAFRSLVIPYVRCDVVFHGIQFWIPFNEVVPSKESPCLCACIAFDICIEYHQPNYHSLLQQEMADPKNRSKWFTTELITKVVGIYVADQIPSFFFSMVDDRPTVNAQNYNSHSEFTATTNGLPLSLALPTEKKHNMDSPVVKSFVSAVRPKVWLVQSEGNICLALLVRTDTNAAFEFTRLANNEWTLIEQPFNIKLNMVVEAHFPTVEIQGFLDYRPYLTMFENTMKPIFDKVKNLFAESLKSDSYNPKTPEDSSKKIQSQQVPHIEQQSAEILPILSIDEIFLHLFELCEVDVKMKIDSLSIILLNDLYQQPISIARIGFCDLDIAVVVPSPPRHLRFVKLERLFALDEDDQQVIQFGKNELVFFHDSNDISTPVNSTTLLSDSINISPIPVDIKTKVPFAGLQSPQAIIVSPKDATTAPSTEDVTFTEALTCCVKFVFNIDYQNQKLIAVEPLLEPVAITMNFNTFRSLNAGHRPLIFVGNADKCSDYSETDQGLVMKYLLQNFAEEKPAVLSPGVKEDINNLSDNFRAFISPPCLSLHTEKINVNVTMALLEIVFLTIKSLEKLNMGYADDFSHVSSRNEVSLLTIRNECGVNLKYWGHEATNTDGEQMLYPNNEMPLKVSSYAESFLSGFVSPSIVHVSKKINIALQSPTGLEQWPVIKNVSLEGVGCRLFSLSEDSNSHGQAFEITGSTKRRRPSSRRGSSTNSASHGNGPADSESNIPSVVLDLVSRNGSKVLTVRSTMRVYNATSSPFTLKLVNGVDKRKKEILWETYIQPNRGMFVPAHLCNLPHGQFLITTFKTNLTKRRAEYYTSLDDSSLQMSEKSGIGEFPCPEIVGISKAHSLSSDGEGANDPNTTADDENDPSTKICNGKKWRKKLHQQRGSINTLTYYHWLNLRDSHASSGNSIAPSVVPSIGEQIDSNSIYAKIARVYDDACCNISIESKGMPLKKHQVSSNSMLRTVTILPTLTIVNLLGSELSFAITPDLESFGFLSGDVGASTANSNNNSLDHLFDFDADLEQIIPQYLLKPGESNQSLSMHSTENIYLSLKMVNNELSSVQDTWSSFVKIPGCNPNGPQHASFNLSVDLPYKNQSKLTVQLEVNDQGGCRTIHCFVPYWVVSSSFIPLQFQHDVQRNISSKGPDYYLNGVDGLAPDQPFEERKALRQENNGGHKLKERTLPRGVGKARGINGVVLGPDLPLKGLPDVLHPIMFPNSGLVSALLASKLRQNHNASSQQKKNIQGSNRDQLNLLQGGSYSDSNENSTILDSNSISVGPFVNTQNTSMPSSYANSNFHLVQFNYTNRDRRQGRIRFRHRNTNWSSSITLDTMGERTLSLESLTRINLDENDDGHRGVNSPFFKDGKKSFHFGINIQSLDAPFQRTKVIFFVDRYNMVNLVGQSIEVKQYQQDNIFTLRSNEEVPLWWRPTTSVANAHVLQIRLARYGWSWSGKFSVDTSNIGKEEGEIPIRLRNDYDNTVYFVLVCIVKQGSQISIVFKGGDQFSPYRFENQTVETFRICQEKQVQVTNLLPYHCCAYAWDEPLANHQFTISILKNALQSQDDWEVIGTYNFERLEFLPLKNRGSKTNNGNCAYSHIVMRVVAQGPTRVLQICDARLPTTTVKGGYDNMINSTFGGNSMQLLKNPVLFHLSCHIQGFGISLVDPTPEELIYISISGIDIHHSVFKKQNHTEIEVARLQIDNQLWSTPYPSLLYPLEPLQKMSPIKNDEPKRSMDANGEVKKSPFISIQLKQDFEYDGIIFLPSFSFDIQPFDINLEGTIIARLVNMGLICAETYGEVSVPTIQQQEERHTSSTKANSWSYYDWADALFNSPWAVNCGHKKLSLSQIQHVNDMINLLYRPGQPSQNCGANGDTSVRSFSKLKSVGKSSVGARGVAVTTATKSVGSLHELNPSAGHISSMGGAVHIPIVLMSKHLLGGYLADVKAKRDNLLQPSPKVYFQKFDISEIRLNISFNPVMAVELNPIEVNSLFMSAINAILLAIGSTVAKIDNCPLKFHSYSTNHIFASSKTFSDSLVSNYAIQAVKQAYLVLFSSEFLGNPVQLVQTLSEGIWDFIHLPMMGLLTSPEAFIVGAARGTNSLVRTLVASVCATAGHLANSLQVGLLALGVVDGYPTSATVAPKTDGSSSRTDSAESPVSTAVTVSGGARVGNDSNSGSSAPPAPSSLTRKALRPTGVYDATKMGLIGFLLDPITGFRENGARGLAIGLAKGSVGLLARPLYGLLGFTAITLEKISFNVLPRFLSHQKLRLQRTRPPRFLISANIPLQVYSADENVGQELLARVEHGSYRHEGYVWHCSLLGFSNSSQTSSVSSNRQLLMTRNRLLLLEDHLEFTEVIWQCTLKAIKSIDIDYSDSTQRKLTEEMKRNLDVALRLMMSDSENSLYRSTTSTSSSDPTMITSSFKSLLEGEPILEIYHIPTTDGSSR